MASDDRTDAHPVELGNEHPLRILLVDDNQVNRVVATRLLARLGYEIETADDGLQAVAAATSATYDLVLMDIAMPGLDGVEATNRIRSILPESRWPRIVAFTAHALEGDREYYLRAGLDAYLAKPVQMRELIQALRDTEPLPLLEGSHAAESGDGPVDTPTEEPAPTDEPQDALGATADHDIGDDRDTGDQVAIHDPFDREALTAMFGADHGPMLEALLPVYFADADLQFEAMRSGLAEHDQSRIRQAAHSLKGASAGMALPLIVHACEAVEVACDHDRADELEALIESARARVDELRAATRD